MMLSITNAIHNVAQKIFVAMLLTGAFPEVGYSETISKTGSKWKSYSMFAYSETWAKFMKILDKWMKQELDPELGVFTRKHSAAFLAKVEELAKDITVADMKGTTERFHTWCDDLKESIVEQAMGGAS